MKLLPNRAAVSGKLTEKFAKVPTNRVQVDIVVFFVVGASFLAIFSRLLQSLMGVVQSILVKVHGALWSNIVCLFPSREPLFHIDIMGISLFCCAPNLKAKLRK